MGGGWWKPGLHAGSRIHEREMFSCSQSPMVGQAFSAVESREFGRGGRESRGCGGWWTRTRRPTIRGGADGHRHIFGVFGRVSGLSSPPVAEKRGGGGDKDDPYEWLRSGSEREVRRHLEKENSYGEGRLKLSARLEKEMLAEMSSRIAEKDEGVPELIEGWHYYMRTEEGNSFPIYCRRLGSMEAPEEVVLDQRKLAESEDFLNIPICKLSPCHTMIAYTADTTGSERFTGFIRDIVSQRVVDTIRDVSSIEWADDSRTIFYTVPDAKRRPCKVYRRIVPSLSEAGIQGGGGTANQKGGGKQKGGDELLLHERDEAFFLDVAKTKDKSIIAFNSNSKTTSEVRVLPAASPNGVPTLVRPREKGVEYFVESCAGNLIIVTNKGSESGYSILQQGRGAGGWEALYAPLEGVTIQDIDVYSGHIAVYERTPQGQQVSILKVAPRPTSGSGGGLVQRSLSCGFPHETVADIGNVGALLQVVSRGTVDLPSTVGVCLQPGANCDFHAVSLRVTASTPISPVSVYDVCLETRGASLVHERLAEGMARWRYNEGDYECELHWAPSHDGVEVPITVMRKRAVARGGAALLEVYGSYGVCLDTSWQEERVTSEAMPRTRAWILPRDRPEEVTSYSCDPQISMLDRGWSIALCHVRGGGELGRAWHVAGRGMSKANSTLDAAACAEYLAKEGLSHASRMAIHGTSAGGLVVGQFINEFPHLVRGPSRRGVRVRRA